MSKIVTKNIIFENLKNSLLKGTFKPRERLIERDLAGRFQTTRITIREAIRKLEALGLVQTSPNLGARVADFSSEEIENLYLVRSHLEVLAATFAVDSISPSAIQELMGINGNLKKAALGSDTTRLAEENIRFHRAITDSCRNSFLIEAVENFRLKCYLHQYYYWKKPQNIKYSISQHEKIIKALQKKNKKTFLSLIQKHLNVSKNNYLQYLSQLKTLQA